MPYHLIFSPAFFFFYISALDQYINGGGGALLSADNRCWASPAPKPPEPTWSRSRVLKISYTKEDTMEGKRELKEVDPG